MEKKKKRHDISAYQFKKGQSGNPKGRPRNRVPEQLSMVLGKVKAKKFFSLSSLEMKEWDSVVITMTLDELKTIAKWDGAPAYPKALAIAIMYDMKVGKTTTIDKLRLRIFGKPVAKIELTGKDGTPLNPENKIDINKLDDDTKAALLKVARARTN